MDISTVLISVAEIHYSSLEKFTIWGSCIYAAFLGIPEDLYRASYRNVENFLYLDFGPPPKTKFMTRYSGLETSLLIILQNE
jgi:hypothetical protein